MPQDDPEHEKVRGRARLGRVPVLPRPGPLPALAHLGQVRVGVVAEVEEAHEHAAGRLDGVGVEVRHGGDYRERQPGQEGNAPVLPELLPAPSPHPALCATLPASGEVTYYCIFHRVRLRRKTVQRARLPSPRETLEAPATRS